MSDIIDQVLGRYTAADNYLTDKRDEWTEYEDLFHNIISDNISTTTKSQMFDPVLSTMAIERSNRVMAQLPVGKVKAMSKNDEGAQKLMNMILEKWVIPNANAQFDFLTKCRIVDLYSNIYGNFFSFIDWCVKDNGYIGPDMWLLNIRDVFPQVGAVSIDDSDFIIVRTWKPLSYFESLKDIEGFKNVNSIYDKLKKMDGDKSQRGELEKSSRESQYPDPIPANKSGQFSVLSMYERDRWVDYIPGAHEIMRDIDNPQENGELPVVCKYSIPLLDDFMAMGDFERGKTEQYALNSLWNLYLDAVKISIFPPTIINKDNIADANSFKFGPAEKWLARRDVNNVAQTLNLTPQGTNTFNNTYQALRGAMQNQFGTSFTDVSSSTDVMMGKTPQALEMQASRQNARDSADRFYMEQFLKKVMNRMTNLISKKQPKALNVRLFPNELEELTRQYPEMQDMYNDKTGQLKIPAGKFKGCIFDYEMVSGSTFQADQQEQQKNLLSLLQMFMQSPQLIQYLQQTEQKMPMLGELITRILANSGINDWDKILVDLNEGNPGQMNDQVLQQHQQIFEQAAQEAMGNMNQIPAQPEGMNGPASYPA